MFKKIFSLNKILFIFATVGCLFFAWPEVSLAGQVDEMVWGGYHDNFRNTTGLSTKDPREMIVGFIRIALGFLGILALMITMMGGFKLLVSGGNEDKAEEAKTMLFNGLVGLIIILASLSLANFVVGAILNATTVG